jgi:SAM-dependent methyltransferase
MSFNGLIQKAVLAVHEQFEELQSVVELGNQTYTDQAKQHFNCEHTWEFYEHLGYQDYLALDVNAKMRAAIVDLNYDLRNQGVKQQFDLVTNNGTGEHVFNQAMVFENMHNLCKVGGVMLNSLPFQPWIDHGFYNFNPCLFRDLVHANDYEWIFAWMGDRDQKIIELDLSDISKERMYDVFKGFRCDNTIHGNHVMIVTAYRKILDQAFKYPVQGVYAGDIESKEMRKKYTPTSALKMAAAATP